MLAYLVFQRAFIQIFCARESAKARRSAARRYGFSVQVKVSSSATKEENDTSRSFL